MPSSNYLDEISQNTKEITEKGRDYLSTASLNKVISSKLKPKGIMSLESHETSDCLSAETVKDYGKFGSWPKCILRWSWAYGAQVVI